MSGDVKLEIALGVAASSKCLDPGGIRYALPAAVLGDRWAVFGRTGSGKTNTAGVMVEEALRLGQQVVVLTPVDAWWGLKFDRTGKKKSGHDILLAGDPRKEHTDLGLTEDMAEALADLLVERRWSAVLTLGHLSKKGQRRFVAAFASRLYFRKQEPGLNSSVTVVLEEAHAFIPQRAEGGDLAMLGALETMCREGRFCGIGLGLIDQRPASVNKNVLNMAEVLLIHQITAPLDKKAIREWLVEHDGDEVERETAGAVIRSLKGLATGEAWVWSPVLLDDLARVRVNLRRTFDSSKTPAPGSQGDKPAIGGGGAKFDLGEPGALAAALGEVAAKAEASDPRKLNEAIGALRAEIAEWEGRYEEAASMLEHERARAGHLAGEVGKAEVRAREDEGRRWRSLVDERERWWGRAIKRVQTHLAERVALAAINVEPPHVGLGPGNTRLPDEMAEAVRVGDGGGEPEAQENFEVMDQGPVGADAVLRALQDAEGSLSSGDLEEASGVSGGTFWRAVSWLVAEDWIEKRREGRRVFYVAMKEGA